MDRDYEPPPQLSPKAIAYDIIASVTLVLGIALIELLITNSGNIPGTVITTIYISELSLSLFSLGYLLKALAYAWDQLSTLIEKIADSKTLPRVQRIFIRTNKILSNVLKIAIKLALLGGAIAIFWMLLIYIFPTLHPRIRSSVFSDPWIYDPPQNHIFSWRYIRFSAICAGLTIFSYFSTLWFLRRHSATK
ncbi:hypothetical protein [Rhodocyclus tenuis]|uniref:Uncharacterized protein n=1 Tax=Rhodocyclus tenuis TaxID=1066 RepID=A0A840GGN7_RHOTE|nr:hypothetical protein [Rhodocyclus tenuis]MBB4247359.1 hypothetical protein [Rhodocyclus tenuis]